MLAFESDIGHALGAACEKNYDGDAMVLAKAATIIRKDLFDLIETKTEFSGNFDINCQNSSVPASLMGLVRMIHEGPNIKDQFTQPNSAFFEEVQWLSGRVLDSRPKGCGFEPHQRHCVVSLSKNINPSLVLVQPRKTRPFITERLLMGRKESNQTNKPTVL